jgi:hypothetical protein
LEPTIYFDLDGVLADFMKAARPLIGGMHTQEYEFIYGPKALWEKLNANRLFFETLPWCHGAEELWAKCAHLVPQILTALPKTNKDSVERQKRRWVASRLGTSIKVITCMTEEKPIYCKPGDILIDDRCINRDAWKAAGGIFVHHRHAEGTRHALQALGIIE